MGHAVASAAPNRTAPTIPVAMGFDPFRKSNVRALDVVIVVGFVLLIVGFVAWGFLG